jgi:tRNA-2-methylthio-N6-dimethylallyladenosine synthase
VLDGSDDFASDLPAERARSWHAWVPITVGCDNHCTYCVVPSVRGPERSREVDDILAECRTLAADGVVEITLLGQNVNSYGRDLYGSPRFAEVLASAAATGVARVRFATSHPKDLSQETIEIIATTPEVCPYVHLPVQSGSNAVLEAMNRRYTRESYLALVDRMRDQIPNLALSTDIIVGFPGETDDDFEDTLELVRAIQPDQAFTFIYSPRAGTPAAKMTETVPRELSQKRFDRLVEVVHASATAKNAALVGDTLDVLFEGPSKRDQTMLTGRTETNKVVHAPVPDADAPDALVGTIVPVRIEAAQTWFLSGALAG